MLIVFPVVRDLFALIGLVETIAVGLGLWLRARREARMILILQPVKERPV